MRPERTTRRRALKLAGAGLLAGTGLPGAAAAAANEIVVSNVGFDESATYEFTVSGSVSPLSSPSGDNVDGNRAWGGVYTWKDGYEFTGEVTSFSHDGPVRVYVNGTEVDPGALGSGDDGSDESEWHEVVVSNVGFDESATYELTASGSVEALSSPSGDNVEGTRAWGGVYTWKDGYRFEGRLTSFSHDGPVRLYVDGEEVDPAGVGSGAGDGGDDGSDEPEWHDIVVSNVGFEESATYEFTVDEAVEPLSEPGGDSVDGTRAWGGVYTWKDGYRFASEVTSFSHDGPVRVYVDGEEVDPDTLGGDGESPPPGKGESFDDFEGGDWVQVADTPGRAGTTTEAAYRGERCGVIGRDSARGRSASVAKDLDSPVDISGKQFSIAMRSSATDHDWVPRVTFVDDDGNEVTHTGKYLSRFTDEWVSIPLGPDEPGSADLTNVVRVVITTYVPTEGDGDVYFDDLRWADSPGRGRVVFTFDDMPDGVYEHAYPVMEANGLTGTMAYWPRAIGRDGYMTDGQTREMVDAGWDCSAHPQSLDGGLPRLSEDEQRRRMRDSKRMLVDKGFTGAEDSIIWPYGEVGETTRDIAAEFFSLGLLAMGGNTAFSLGSRFDAARTNGENVENAMARIDAAEEMGTTCVLMYHDIDGGDISPTEFERVVEHAAGADVDVVTVGEWLQERRAELGE